MQTVNFKCGHCGNLMGVSTDFLGQQVRCPHCQQVVVAPAASPSVDATLPQAPSSPVSSSGDTSWLPPSTGVASIFSEGDVTADATGEMLPPRLEIPPSARDATTLALDGRAASSGPPLDATMAYQPGADYPPSLPEAPPSSSPDIPDWMKGSEPAPAPSAETAPDHNGEALPLPPPVQAPHGGTSLGTHLFWSLVFMPLVLYSILVTVLAVMFYLNSINQQGPPDPREYLNDLEGDHPGAKKVKVSGRTLLTDSKYATSSLPTNLRFKLGEALELGDLRIKAEGVEWADVKMIAKNSNKPEVRETLKLKLHLTNLSKEAAFYPMDCFFDRKSTGQGSSVPLTVLIAGDKLRFFGGPANWNRGPVNRNDNPDPRYFVLGNNYDKDLKPGEEMDTFVCTNGPDPRYDSDPLQPKFNELKAYKGSFIWHVHLRRGFVHWKDHDYSATAVCGVEFTDEDIQHTN